MTKLRAAGRDGTAPTFNCSSESAQRQGDEISFARPPRLLLLSHRSTQRTARTEWGSKRLLELSQAGREPARRLGARRSAANSRLAPEEQQPPTGARAPDICLRLTRKARSNPFLVLNVIKPNRCCTELTTRSPSSQSGNS